MALASLTASHDRVCALLGTKCCVYIPNIPHNVSHVLWAWASETHAIKHLRGDPLQEWWASMNKCGGPLLSWVAELVFWSLGAAACTAVVALGCRALSSSPRDPCGTHPHVDCMVRSPEVMEGRENGVSQAAFPRYQGDYDSAVFIQP